MDFTVCDTSESSLTHPVLNMQIMCTEVNNFLSKMIWFSFLYFQLFFRIMKLNNNLKRFEKKNLPPVYLIRFLYRINILFSLNLHSPVRIMFYFGCLSQNMRSSNLVLGLHGA